MSDSILIKRMEKIVRAPDGTMRKMYSYDGEVWRMDPHKARRAHQLDERLHGEKRSRKQKSTKRPITAARKFDTANDRWASDPQDVAAVILPVTETTSPLLGKAKGKNQTYRPNLKPHKVKEVPMMRREHMDVPRPFHKHRCHGRFYDCSCDTPYFRRPCGGSHCLMNATLEHTKLK